MKRLLFVTLSLAVFTWSCGLTDQGPESDDGADAGVDAGPQFDDGPPTEKCDQFETLDGIVDTDTTVGSDAGCLFASSGISIADGATLTVEPGTVIAFDENTDMLVRGQLVADGSSEERIALTGLEQKRGWWNGVTFDNSDSSRNVLDHVTVEFAGGNDSSNLALTTCCGRKSSLTLTNSTLRHSAGFGLSASDGGTFAEFAGNTITDNKLGAVAMDLGHLDELDDTTNYGGNDTDLIRVRGGAEADDVVWPTFDVPVRIAANVGVDGSVTISKSNTFEFAENTGMNVAGGLRVSGESGERRVRFTGTKQEPGWWSGMAFVSSDSSENVLEYATIEYAGAENGANLVATTCCGQHTRLSVRHTILRHSEGYGLRADSRSAFEAFAGNDVSDNAQGAARVDASVVGDFAASNSFSGNAIDNIRVDGTVPEEATWQSFEVPYFIEGRTTVPADVTLTIRPGAEFVFAKDTGMIIGGALTAEGESNDKIRFRGDKPQKGYWTALTFENTDSDSNKLDHVVISDAGGNDDGNLVLKTCCGRSTAVTIDNTELSNGESAGIYADRNASMRGCSGNSVNDCSPEGYSDGDDYSLNGLNARICN